MIPYVDSITSLKGHTEQFLKKKKDQRGQMPANYLSQLYLQIYKYRTCRYFTRDIHTRTVCELFITYQHSYFALIPQRALTCHHHVNGADFHGADIHSADIHGADGADIHGADGADIHGADIHGTDGTAIHSADGAEGAYIHVAAIHEGHHVILSGCFQNQTSFYNCCKHLLWLTYFIRGKANKHDTWL